MDIFFIMVAMGGLEPPSIMNIKIIYAF